MGDYVKLTGLTPSLVCLIGLVPNFIYYYDPGSKIKKSKILQLIEPSKEEMKEIVRWIELNYWDEVVPILSFSKRLTIHQLACPILRIEKLALMLLMYKPYFTKEI